MMRQALDPQLAIIFVNGKNMAISSVNLLYYDLLIVQTGGENTHNSDLFAAWIWKLIKPVFFALIDQATTSLADIK